jgi:hypothetical protein
MRSKKTARKAKLTSNKVLIARVTKEIGQPLMTQSAQTKTDKQVKPRDEVGLRPRRMNHPCILHGADDIVMALDDARNVANSRSIFE